MGAEGGREGARTGEAEGGDSWSGRELGSQVSGLGAEERGREEAL